MTSANLQNDIDFKAFFVQDRLFYKQLILLAIPMILQNLLTFGVIFSDNLMVGRLGDTAISGLYMGTLANAVLQILLFGVESSLLILAAQYWGRRNCDRIKDVISIGMRISLGLAAFFTFGATFLPGLIMDVMTTDKAVAILGKSYLQNVGISYLFFTMSEVLIIAMRSVEVVRIGLINSITAFCVNVTLNYLLIFGFCGLPAFGVRGAAWATDISRIVEFSVVLYFVLKRDNRLLLRVRDFLRWDSDIFHDLVKYGTPILLGQIVWAFNNIWQGWVIGRLDKTAITAASITGMFDRLLWMGTWGLAGATGILVGKAIGAGEFARVKQYSRTMQCIFAGIGLFSSLLVLGAHNLFLSFYALSADSHAIASQFMLVLACIMIGRCYQAPCLYGLVKSGGDTAFVFKNDAFWVFLWIVPASWLALHFHLPPWLVFAFLLSDQLAKCFVALWKINSYNWMKNLTRF